MIKVEEMKTRLKEAKENAPSRKVLFRVFRKWHQREFVSPIAHESILTDVIDEGGMTPRYAFMVTMSCAIATLGLLLSSPAVIIGAMLISPLMGPIMSLGFSLCTIDFLQMKKSLIAIAGGFFLSLAIASVIVFVSPITDPTPEIIARTQPNLFDLMVAIFSGLAGGYATIKQKGAAIVGVAIATALMPPLAVVGYGVATASWPIIEGAFFLFMTNLLAISLTVTMLAKWYGFGIDNSHKHTLFQSALVFMVFIILSVPLGLSLSKIAYQSYVTKTAKAEIQAHFAEASSRMSNFSISFKGKEEINVDCIMITDLYEPRAQEALQNKLQTDLGRKINLSLDQIVVAKQEQEKIAATPEKIADTALSNTILANPLQPKPVTASVDEDVTKTIQAAISFPAEFINVDKALKTAAIYPKPALAPNLDVLYDTEKELRTRFQGWDMVIVPPTQVLPFVYFDKNRATLNEAETRKIDYILWAIRRWNISEAVVVGYTSSISEYTQFNANSLAYRRARNVMAILKDGGVTVRMRPEYQNQDAPQDATTLESGNTERVEIRLVKGVVPPADDAGKDKKTKP